MTTLPVHPTAAVPTRSRELVSEIMRRIRSRNTEPESIFRSALRRAGVRSFRACDAALPGKPDIVLPGKRLVVFIDGDFWHGHQYQTRGFESQEAQLRSEGAASSSLSHKTAAALFAGIVPSPPCTGSRWLATHFR
jgi:DNA mismatch endonuclease Vsr